MTGLEMKKLESLKSLIFFLEELLETGVYSSQEVMTDMYSTKP